MDNYIAEYSEKINNGEIVAGAWIKKWYEHINAGIAEGKFFYNEKKANLAIAFVEKFCRHHEGALAPNLIKLELWQKALLSVLFGIVDDTGNRQFREAFIVVGRKNGKTVLMAAISAYMAFLDGEYGGRIYYAAPKLEQAGLCYEGFYQMVSKEPALAGRVKRRRTDVYIEESNTTAKPLAFNAKKSDGLNISLCVADEVASWGGDQGLKFYEVLKSSFGARTQPLLLSISTAGYLNDGVYDELLKRSTAVLNGASKESRLAPFLYIIDDVEKWNDLDELKKANPNLDISVSSEYMREEIAIAEGSISKKAEFITKYCNVKQNSSSAWLDFKTVDNASGEELTLDDFRGCYCVGGIDLSQSVDLTACCIVVERNKQLYVISKAFMPTERLDTAIAEDGAPYNIFIKNGWADLSGTNFVDYNDCFEWFKQLIEEYKIYPLVVGYDRYSSQYLVDQMKAYGFLMDDVYQGYNLSAVIKQTEGELKDGTIHIGNNNLLKSHLLNAALKHDTESQKVKLIKLGKRTRIDCTAALLDALTVRAKWSDEYGAQLANN